MNLFDNFERADSVDGLAGSTLSGGGAVWQKVAGFGNTSLASAGILSGKAYLTSAQFKTFIVADSTTNNGELVVTRITEINDSRYIFRYIDLNNYIFMKLDTSVSGLFYILAGVETSLYSTAAVSNDTLKVVLTAAHQVTLYKNGVQVHTSTLPAGLNAGTKHGFTSFSTGVKIAEYNFVDTVAGVSGTDAAPVNTVPANQTIIFNTYVPITGISVNDDNNNLASTKLTASSGFLKLDFAGGAHITAGSNNGSTITIGGTQAQINAALASLTYRASVAGTYSITVLSTDSTGTPLTDSDAFNVTVNPAVNPVNTVPGAQTVVSNAALAITDVSVNDGDGNLATTKLTVVNGKVTVTLGGGATISAGVNNSTTLTLSGTQTQINSALGTISYTSNLDYVGSDTLTVLSSDSSNTPLTDSDTIGITVTSAVVTNAPVNTVPSSQTATTNISKAITGISVNDVDGNLATTRLTATAGLLGVSLAGGATISAGANNSSTLTLSGTQTQINAALATLTYIHTTAGSFTITVLSTDSSATPLTDSDTITVVVEVPQTAPVNTVPGTQTANTNVAKNITGISVTDAENNLSTTRLTASNGIVTVSLTGGATITAGANNSATLTLSGTLTQINAALATVSYTASIEGTHTITVLSTDSGSTPLTDSDVITITATDLYAIQGTDFNANGLLSHGVTINTNGQWVPPAGTIEWTFTVTTFSDDNYGENDELISLTVEGVTATATLVNNPNNTVNPANEVFIAEASYKLLSPSQQTAVETNGGGYPLFIVTKNAADTTNAFDVIMAPTINGTYTPYLSNQLFTPTARITGEIDRIHPAFAISEESGMPTTIVAGTKALMYDTAGQIEWLELDNVSTKTDENNISSIRLVETSRTAIWDIPKPIKIDLADVARIALLNNPVVGTTVIADSAQVFFKVIPKVLGGASVNPALVTPIPLTIKSKSRKPYPVRDIRFSRNTAAAGSAFPETDLDQGNTWFYFFPSSRTETATSGFFHPATAFEEGVTVHVDVKTVGGQTLIRLLQSTNGTSITYTEAQRTQDTQRYSTQYEVYTKKNGIESERFIGVINQRITAPFNNAVTGVATTIVSPNIRAAVTLTAAAGGTSGTGQETGVYIMKLSGTLFPTVNMDTMTIENDAATISSYDKASGEIIVLAPYALPDFVLIVPYTGTGTISVFAGLRESEGKDVGITSTTTI